MNERMQKEKDKGRKVYEKPLLRKIELTAEEIMGSCKINAGYPGGPFSSFCSVCGTQFGGS